MRRFLGFFRGRLVRYEFLTGDTESQFLTAPLPILGP